jgi:hypothetical protein
VDLEGAVEKIAEGGGGQQGLGSGPRGDAEGSVWMSTGRCGVCVVRAENVLDKASVNAVIRLNAIFGVGVDEEVLTTDWAANTGREFRWLACVH